jgi:hypothetical protein
MAVVASTDSQQMVDGLNKRHASYGVFAVKPGKRFDKIIVTPNGSTQTFVHAFVECETGYVYKPNGWKSPAKGVRYTTVREALMCSDPYGGYLYR